MFELKADNQNKLSYTFFKEFENRTNAFKRAAGFYLSQQLLEDIKQGIKQSKDTEEYRNSIKIALVNNASKKDFIYAVVLANTSKKLKKLEVTKNLINIKTIKRFGKSDKKAEILERFSPWTLDTLPFVPDKSKAELINVKAAEYTVTKVTKARNQDKHVWQKELIKAGVPISTFNKKLDLNASKQKTKTSMDLEAQRLEFGLDGNQNGSHWRLAIDKLVSSNLIGIMQDKKLDKILNDPSYSEWRNFTPKIAMRITPQEARNFVTFQKKLGIIQ